MAEFPGFGCYCSVEDCHRLDFLPVVCDACKKEFCASHFTYDAHSCPSAYKKDVQVPVCPLCGKAVPVAKGELPDQRVGEHIDTDCQSDPAKTLKGKIYINRCALPGCKKRELVPIHCEKCEYNYCIRHRLPVDHDCMIMATRVRTFPPRTIAASKRDSSHSSDSTNTHPSSQNKSENTLMDDEALARALQESMNDGSVFLSQEDIYRKVAEDLQRMEYQAAAVYGQQTSLRFGNYVHVLHLKGPMQTTTS